MSFDLLIALTAFAFVASITPGPNNLMLMSSGASFGLRRTIPHILGAVVGFVFMLILVGFGLIKLFEQYPASYDVLKFACSIFLFYLAVKIARAAPLESTIEPDKNPLSFFGAAIFQWINPKGWTTALTIVTVYAPNQNIESLAIVAVIFGLINLPSASLWAVLGQQFSRVLTSKIRFKVFNIMMAGLLLISLYPSFFK